MNTKSKKILLATASISIICIIGIMLLMDSPDKKAHKQATNIKGAAYQSKIVPVVTTEKLHQKPLVATQQPEAAAITSRVAAQKPQATKPANKISASQQQSPAIVHAVKPSVTTASTQSKQQPVNRAITVLKLEEATSISHRKKPQQHASKITAKKITALKLKKSTVVESMHNAWVIQLGSFSNTTNAINLRDKLERAGFTSFVETAKIDNKKTMRVYVGPETTLRGAKKVLARLKKEQNMKGIIVGYNG